MRPMLAIQRTLPFHARARADEAHVALQDVPELWNFVEAQFANELTERRDPRIFLKLLKRVPFGSGHVVAAQIIVEHFFRVVPHGTKVVEPKALASFAKPVLPEVHGPTHADRHAKCYRKVERAKKGEEHERAYDI